MKSKSPKLFRTDFNRRVEEINKYFDLVDKIESLGTFSLSSISFPSGDYQVDQDIQKIMKSNCYLLLYNLIESSIRNGITAIHDAISIEQLTYQELSSPIKKLWLMNDISKKFMDSYIKKETIVDNLKETIEAVLDLNPVNLNPSNIPISGNLDAKTINDLINMYELHGKLGVPKKEIDEILNSVVRLRCNLAHGNVSFSDGSNQIGWSQLINEKEKIVIYLTNFLKNIDDYIDKQKYKK